LEQVIDVFSERTGISQETLLKIGSKAVEKNCPEILILRILWEL